MDDQKLRIVVVGAGGHAEVIVEALRAIGTFAVVGLTDPATAYQNILGVPVLGGDELLPNIFAQGVRAAVVAIGSNRLRQKLGQDLFRIGFSLPKIIHPSALISPSATIGDGTVIMAGAIVGTLAKVGKLAIINTGAIVEHDNRIGDFAHIAPGAVLAGGVRIGDRVLVGIGSTIRPDISVGDDVIVGAGSAVVADVHSGARVAGVPARERPSK